MKKRKAHGFVSVLVICISVRKTIENYKSVVAEAREVEK